jgi:hypothetical protein
MKILRIVFILLLTGSPAMAVLDLQTSKIMGYGVLEGLDLRVAKIMGYAVLEEAPARGSHGYIFGQWRSVADRCEWNT